MKTIITNSTENLSKAAAAAVRNPQGMVLQNTPEIRNAVAWEMKSIIENLHKNSKK